MRAIFARLWDGAAARREVRYAVSGQATSRSRRMMPLSRSSLRLISRTERRMRKGRRKPLCTQPIGWSGGTEHVTVLLRPRARDGASRFARTLGGATHAAGRDARTLVARMPKRPEVVVCPTRVEPARCGPCAHQPGARAAAAPFSCPPGKVCLMDIGRSLVRSPFSSVRLPRHLMSRQDAGSPDETLPSSLHTAGRTAPRRDMIECAQALSRAWSQPKKPWARGAPCARKEGRA